jgi:hypothetical protein
MIYRAPTEGVLRAFRFLRPAALVLMAAVGAALWWHSYGSSLESWFLREDSRFFGTAPFSFYDLWLWFSSAQNGMHQYRPVTKVLWALPRYFGLFDPTYYHWITIGLLAGAGTALFLLLRRFGVGAALALGFVFFYAFMPIHGKPLYWISAWHNIALACFTGWAIFFRFKMQDSPLSSLRYRLLSLFFYFLAIGSREAGLLMIAPLAMVDLYRGSSWKLTSRLRGSIDLAAMFVLFVLFLYVFHSPGNVTQASQRGLTLDFSSAEALWRYLLILIHHPSESYLDFKDLPIALHLATLLLTGAGALALYLDRRAGILLLAGGASIGLHLLFTDFWFAEYALTLGFALTGAWAICLHQVLCRLRVPRVVPVFLGLAVMLIGFLLSMEGADWYRRHYIAEGESLRLLTQRAEELQRSLPPHQPILVRGFVRMQDAPFGASLHWIAQGFQEFIPGRFFLFDTAGSWVAGGFGFNELDQAFYLRFMPPIPELRYPEDFE